MNLFLFIYCSIPYMIDLLLSRVKNEQRTIFRCTFLNDSRITCLDEYTNILALL